MPDVGDYLKILAECGRCLVRPAHCSGTGRHWSMGRRAAVDEQRAARWTGRRRTARPAKLPIMPLATVKR